MFRFFAVLSCLATAVLAADSYEIAGGSFKAMREINVPSAALKCPVLVTAFLHEGLIDLDSKTDPCAENAGKTVIVVDKKKKVVPFRVLQLGPGDFCRIAIQAEEKNNEYTVYYGCAGAVTPIDVPPWTSNVGLLMETRRFVNCDMDKADSVREAFRKGVPIGADYVDTVYHGYNPMVMKQESFMSRYTGTLVVNQGGTYAMIVSTHHCGFALIDGREVASHPGRHGRSWEAKPELVKRVPLTQGPHKFEFLHASADNDASILLCWELNPGEKVAKPVPIPPEAFQAEAVGRIQAAPAAHADSAQVPDFEYQITGSVPLPDNSEQMICVRFTNRTASATLKGKTTWDFGDGQTSTEASPYHIYLKPGLFNVTLSGQIGDNTFSTVNRIDVEQPVRQPEKAHTLDNYLDALEKYDAGKLPPDHVLALIQAFEFKIDQVAGGAGRDDIPIEQMLKPTREAVLKYRKLIVDSVKASLTRDVKFNGDHEIRDIALSAGTIARDLLGDLKTAGQIYNAAAAKIQNADMSAECSALAADVALDMGLPEAAKRLLDTAEKRMNKTAINTSVATVFRVKGDYLSAIGDGGGAREAFRTAQERNFLAKGYAEKVALQGSASRSAEGFLKAKHYERAIEMLRVWQNEYHAAAIDGYITLLFAEYWFAKGEYDLAASLADRLITVNPDAPYVDRILIVAAEAKYKEGNRDAAQSYLQTLVKNYPGSPLISEANEMLDRPAPETPKRPEKNEPAAAEATKESTGESTEESTGERESAEKPGPETDA